MKIYLANHLKIVHQNLRHECDVCKKEYSTVGGLQNHLSIHKDVQIHKQRMKCELCPGTFRDKYRLAFHMESHQSEKIETKKLYQCPYCPKVKSNSRILKRHVIIVHNRRDYTCHFCERDLITSAHLRVRSHTCILNFYCKISSFCMRNRN